MKKGRFGLTADFRDWPSLWGHTYARDGVAPPSVRESLLFPFMGFDEGCTPSLPSSPIWRATTCASRCFTSPSTRRRPVSHLAHRRQVVCRDRNLAIAVSASDSGCGIAQVQLYLNEVTSTTPVSVDTTRPFQLTVPKELLHVDSLRIIVRAIDRAGRSSLAEITVRPILYCLMGGTVRR